MKLPAFARTRPLLFSRTGFSNLLNKIQFTFEVVPCLISGLFRRFFRRCASILAQCYKGVGGWEEREGRVGWGRWGGRRQKPPGEDTRWPAAHRWSWPYNQAEGTSFWSRVEFQADNAQLVRSTGANVSVMISQGPKSTPQKSRPLESGHREIWC